MKIICISDTHLRHLKQDILIPDGDVLIHSGDATFRGTEREIQMFSDWFGALPHKHKIFVAGNHDWGFETNPFYYSALLPVGTYYLHNTGCEIEGVKFWGTSIQPFFCDWAFNVSLPSERKNFYDLIPNDTDVLITHCPPFGHLDQVIDESKCGVRTGCEELRKAVERVKPKLHCFGHIHGGYGIKETVNTVFVNASICDEDYDPVNPAITVNLVFDKEENGTNQ